MTCQQDCSQFDLAMELLIENGFDNIADVVGVLMNTAMQIERSRHLQAIPYERTDDRRGSANGYKSKTMKTRFGEVSRASATLDEQLKQWRERPLEAFPYVYLDARYEKVRHGGVVVSSAVLVAIGVSSTGHREVLGVSVKLSENEVHWRDFLSSLKDRGLHGVKLFISDAHEGLKAARRAIFPTVPWQRCQFHLQQNAQNYVPRRRMKQEVAERIRSIFTAPNDEEAQRLLAIFLDDYRQDAPELATWAETALQEGLVVMSMPKAHRKRLRTVNMLERLNKEILRRTRVATLFPNTESCLRLVTAVAMETSEEWQASKVYLKME